ncbi:hypothetical protein [Nocardia arthritidis]|uniref:Uncharacterized protein n=1 Tax=Nocardia arthritidis TaxID=228602 RepID=A0A6G9YEF9_9NOCA|nr:hypothetical protein [Nocardia arthritidis]QIS11582.1 hypothetical protein F5544_18550 [Nocardia arthritidis]
MSRFLTMPNVGPLIPELLARISGEEYWSSDGPKVLPRLRIVPDDA